MKTPTYSIASSVTRLSCWSKVQRPYTFYFMQLRQVETTPLGLLVVFFELGSKYKPQRHGVALLVKGCEHGINRFIGLWSRGRVFRSKTAGQEVPDVGTKNPSLVPLIPVMLLDPIERGDACHLLVRERKAVYVQVLGDVLRIG